MNETTRYVVLGLASPRSAWFRDIAQWAHAGVIPVEFVKCVSTEELRARLASTRPHSALVIDGAISGLDRDLVGAARARECAVIAIGTAAPGLEVDALLAARFAPSELCAALAAHARLIGRADVLPGPLDEEPAAVWEGSTAMVCGPGGTGASTAAIALAQGLATDGRATALVDLSLRGEQAMLHAAPDVGPGVQELSEAHGAGSMTAAEVVAMTWHVEARGYNLLLGLRRRRSWPTIRPRAFEHAFHSLRRAFDVTVADCDSDLEGEAEGGSVDVEERHVMARTAARTADVVFVVTQPGMKGIHAAMDLVTELTDFGVPSDRLVVVVNRAPRQPRLRAEMTRALGELARKSDGEGLPGPLFLPRRPVDQALRDGIRLPSTLVRPLVGAYHAVVDRVGGRPCDTGQPAALLPGTIGSWSG